MLKFLVELISLSGCCPYIDILYGRENVILFLFLEVDCGSAFEIVLPVWTLLTISYNTA
jgi:hypothetical protein